MAEKGKEKVTWMKLKVHLDSDKNVKKVKHALCSIPQIRDQVFDEKSSTVTIKVVCCSPEKIMDKLCSKGRGAIRLIETIDPPKPEGAQKPKEAEKPKPTPAPTPAPAPNSQPTPAPAPTPARAPNSQPIQAPTMGQPMIMNNGYYYVPYQQPYSYETMPIDHSYGDRQQPQRQPPTNWGYFSDENPNGCSIM